MLFRTIVSVFVLPPTVKDSLTQLAQRAGVSELYAFDTRDREMLGFFDPAKEVVGGTWPPFGETWAIVDEIDGLRCLHLYSPLTRYLRAIAPGVSPETVDDEPPTFPYIRAFRNACLTLGPIAAWLDTQPHDGDDQWVNRQGNRDEVRHTASLVAAGDADALVQKFFSLLYLNSYLSARLNPESLDADREMLSVPTGRLIFAGSGATRMA